MEGIDNRFSKGLPTCKCPVILTVELKIVRFIFLRILQVEVSNILATAMIAFFVSLALLSAK